MVNAFDAAVKSLFTGRCTVTVRSFGEPDPDTGRAPVVETAVLTDEPCRVSFTSVTVTEPVSGAERLGQRVTLYIRRDAVVPPGSKITVAQNGATNEYEQSGVPAVYTVHQEIPLALFGGWA